MSHWKVGKFAATSMSPPPALVDLGRKTSDIRGSKHSRCRMRNLLYLSLYLLPLEIVFES